MNIRDAGSIILKSVSINFLPRNGYVVGDNEGLLIGERSREILTFLAV